ncbi:uncharacterized protein HD556DRAFT_1247607, partial [Suillus plorans]
MATNSKLARVEQLSASKPPFLTAGELTPEALRSWELGCTQFFLHKEVKEGEMVKKVAWGMQDPVMQDWYSNNQVHLDKLTFKDYMAEVRSYWLPSGWADTVRRKMLSSTQGQRPFHEWASEFQSRNTLLRGTTSHLADANILYHLESHMNPELAADYQAEQISETDLRKWIEKVRLLDERRLRYLVRQRDAVDAALRAERARSGGEKKFTAGTRYNARAGQTATSTTSSSKTFTRLPTLTDNERQLLRDNDGCFKCREPFAGHSSSNCSKGFPDGSSYKTLTAAMIASKKSKKGSGMVAAVDVDEDHTVAVVMPSAVLGDGTDSEECVAPLQTPHLRWDCLVTGPAVSSSVRVSALIDHGSSLVLVDEALSHKLGLRLRKLPKQLSISLALSKTQKQSFILSHFVKISCSSLDNAYTSRTVRAIVAPNLCTPLLLGGPFLQHNRIVIDHELRMCIAKDAGYDLLHPQSPAPHIKKAGCETVRGVDIVAAVQNRINNLEQQTLLDAKDSAMKMEFKDHFPTDIPHNDSLPSDVLFRVQLKDANQIVQKRSYDCPKKYRAAWKV